MPTQGVSSQKNQGIEKRTGLQPAPAQEESKKPKTGSALEMAKSPDPSPVSHEDQTNLSEPQPVSQANQSDQNKSVRVEETNQSVSAPVAPVKSELGSAVLPSPPRRIETDSMSNFIEQVQGAAETYQQSDNPEKNKEG